MVYTEKPDNFEANFEVVGCFVEWQDLFLLLERQEGKSEAGMYGLVGGKVEPEDVDIFSAMVREMQEEIDFVPLKDDLLLFQTVYVRNFNYSAIFHLFSLKVRYKIPVTISNTEHKSYQWVTKPEALKLPLMEDMVPCIYLTYPD